MSPTTEHGGWRRATIVDGLLAVQRDAVTAAAAKSGVTSVVELEICPCRDALQDAVDEPAVGEHPNNDVMVDSNETRQHLSD